MNIYFVGGSITEGTGASDYKNSYVALVSQYFRSVFKEGLTIINLGAGGTASEFGLFRIGHYFREQKPDVVFLEFSVNDRIYPLQDINIYYENLIIEIFKWNKNVKIISLEMPTGMSDSCSTAHKRIAYHYNIPVIDVQDHVWREIGQDKYSWRDIAIDDLHPNDNGHKIYGEIVIEELEKLKFENVKCLGNKKPIGDYVLKNPKIKSYEEFTFYGNWSEKEVNLNNKFKVGAITNNIGDCVEVNFSGRYLSLMAILSNKSGILECIFDHKITLELDLYMDKDEYFSTIIIVNDLEDGKHNLLMKVSEKRNPESFGNEIIIGGVLVEEGKC